MSTSATRPDDAAHRAGTTPGVARIVLLGRPNAGKSSLYNVITGGHARVGNFPGLTVEALEASVDLGGGRAARVIDLPGIYSVETATDDASDEGHARTFLERSEREPAPLLVAQILDATQLALGLRLTAELLRRRTPLALVITQRDLLTRDGRTLDPERIADALGVPVIAVSALDPDSRPRLHAFLRDALDAAASAPGPASTRPAFDAEALAHAAAPGLVLAPSGAPRPRSRTERIDAVLLHPAIGPLFFISLMTALFASVFLVADPASRVIDAATRAAADLLRPILGDGLLGSLVEDGVLGGAGTVLAFLPQIVILTLAMEVIDASGYLARGSFLVDRILRAAGLGGRSFVPLLTAHACAVPAVQSARAIRDPAQRLRTILVLPLMTCSARIPTYGLLIAAFFSGRSAWFKGSLFVGLYFAGIATGLVASLVLGRTVRRTARSLPLVLEMPAYRMPRPGVVARVALRTCTRFLKDVGTVILVSSCVLWVLLTVPGPGASTRRPTVDAAPGDTSEILSPRVQRMHDSLAASVGRAIEPVTSAAGFDWRINVGLIGSFGARELMVSTLGVIFGIEGDSDEDAGPLAARIRAAKSADGRPAYGPSTALALMAFFVIACQCMSTLAAIYRETGSFRWPVFVAVYTYAAGFAAAVLVYRVSLLVGLG